MAIDDERCLSFIQSFAVMYTDINRERERERERERKRQRFNLVGYVDCWTRLEQQNRRVRETHMVV